MARYYRGRAPWELLVRLAKLQGPLGQCEFACWCKEFVARYVHGDAEHALRRSVDNYLKNELVALHIGPAYSDGLLPRDRKRARDPSVPVARLLSFDVDLTDYDHLHLDPKDVAACDAAWPMAAIAAVLLRHLLHDAFGFEQMLVVYSGRRGVHLHVLDEGAVRLGDEARKAIVANLNYSAHKEHRRANDALRQYVDGRPGLWEEIDAMVVEVALDPAGLDLLGFAHQRDAFVDALHLTSDRFGALREAVRAAPTGREAYAAAKSVLAPHFPPDEVAYLAQLLAVKAACAKRDALLEELAALQKLQHAHGSFAREAERQRAIGQQLAALKPQTVDPGWVRHVFRAAVLALVWPRIDAGVATLNHTIRCPLSVHDKAARLATPVPSANPREVFAFDPRVDAVRVDPDAGDVAEEALPAFARARAVLEGALAAAERARAPATQAAAAGDIEDLVRLR